jgi:hypothetical protein
VVVIFCGKIYNGVCIETHGKPVYFWHKERFEDWMAGCGVEMYNSYWRPIDWHAFFTAREASKTLLNWLMTQRVVVAIRFPTTRQTRATSPLRWSINSDRLKEVQFYRVFDAFAAFQEIAMWIGGVLPSNGNAMVAISDTIRLEKHGFSKRSSFRNMER